MTDKLSSLSIFLPAYNEEHNIKSCVMEALESAKQVADKFEVIIVDDASTDGTARVAERMEKVYSGLVRLVRHKINQGYGGALTTGIKEAQYDYVFFTDADLQFDLKELCSLAIYAAQYDAVIGYRQKRKDSLIRLINARGWNILNRILFGLKVKDIDCAFKLMKRRIVAHLPIQSKGAMVSAEMLILLNQIGASIKEVGVTHFPRKHGIPTGAHPKVILKAFREMLSVFMSEVGRPTRVQLFTFGIIGIFNTLVDLGSYFLLTRHVSFFTQAFVLAKALSFFIGTLSSFLLNKFITFDQKKFSVVEVFRFYMIVGFSLVINSLLTYTFISVFRFYDLVGVALATVITLIINFVGSKLFVFKEKKPRGALHVGSLNIQTS